MEYLRKNLYQQIGTLIIGIISLITALFFYENSTLFALGTTLTFIGMLGTIRLLKLKETPEKCKMAEISETEERSVYIREKTNSFVYRIFIYVESISCVIAAILGYKDITIVLAVLGFGKLIIWFIICNRIAKEN